MLKRSNLQTTVTGEGSRGAPCFSGLGLGSAINEDWGRRVHLGTTVMNSTLSKIRITYERYLLNRAIQRAIREMNPQLSQDVCVEKSVLGIIVSGMVGTTHFKSSHKASTPRKSRIA